MNKTVSVTNPNFKKYHTFPDDFDVNLYKQELEQWLDSFQKGLNPVAYFHYGEKVERKTPTGCFISGT